MLIIALVLVGTVSAAAPVYEYATEWGGFNLYPQPGGIAVNSSGYVYVTDPGNNLIKIFIPSGSLVSTLTPISGSIPVEITFDSSDNAYVSDWNTEGVIDKYPLSGSPSELSISAVGSPISPMGIAISSGNFYIADLANVDVGKFSSSGAQLNTFGEGPLQYPAGVTVDPTGNVSVVDNYNNRVYKFPPAGGSPLWESTGDSSMSLSSPWGIARDSFGNIYVADESNNCIQILDTNGNYISKLGSLGDGQGKFNTPADIAIDASNNVYVLDTGNNLVQKFVPLAISTVTPAIGSTSGGTSVTITGTGFNSVGTTQVTFGGIAGTSVHVVNPTTITVTTPAHVAGAVNIVVTDPDSNTGTLANGFTYVVPPVFSSILPNSGTTLGGTAVTITGSGFVTGSPLAVTISGNRASDVVFGSSTSITAVTPAGTAGSTWVNITNGDGGIVNTSAAYTYIAPPVFTSISPASGTTLGGTAVTITGSDFVAGSSLGVTIGGTPATGVSVTDATHIAAITPAGTDGSTWVNITNGNGGTVNTSAAYTYVVPPIFSSILPNSGTTLGGTAVTITGSGFIVGSPFAVTIGGNRASDVVFGSSTSITAVTPAGTAGSTWVNITNGDGGTVNTSAAYTYIAPPVFTRISPASGTTLGGTAVTITGSGFNVGSPLAVTIGGNSASDVVFSSSTSITAVTPAGTAGSTWVNITNGDGGTVNTSAAYAYIAPPVFTSISPASGPLSGGTSVTIDGTGFVTGSSLGVTIGGAPTTGVSVTDTNHIAATTPAGITGSTWVNITNGNGGFVNESGVYTYDALPTFTSILPSAGPLSGGQPVTITGTGFVTGASLRVTIGGTPATGVSVTDATHIAATTPAGTTGSTWVNITNGDGGFVNESGGYTYDALPTFTSIVPSAGPLSGGQPVTITGTGFVTGASLRVTIGGAPATGVSVTDTNHIAATTPAGITGSTWVNITNGDGGIVNTSAAYTYVAPPVFTSIVPSAGPLSGSQPVSITGSGFITGSSLGVTIGGTPATGVSITDATHIAATTPAGTTGSTWVNITNGNDGFVNQTGAYTYAANPTVTGVYPASGPLSGGTSVTITGTGFTGATSVTFGTIANVTGAMTVNSATSITVTSPAGSAGTVDVTVTTPGGTSSPSPADKFTYGSAPTFVSATTTTTGTAINITFSKAMNSPVGYANQFSYSINGGTPQSFSAAVLDSNTAVIDLTTSGAAIAYDNTVTINYTGTSVTSTDGGVLATFSNQHVTNAMPGPTPTLTPTTSPTVTPTSTPTISPTITPKPTAATSHPHAATAYWVNTGNTGTTSGYTGPATTPAPVKPTQVSTVQPIVSDPVTAAATPSPAYTEPPLPTNTPKSGINAIPVIGALGLCGVIVLFRKNGN